VMIRPWKFSEPLLPRPFSIHRVQGHRIDLLIRKAGQGTRQLGGLSPGEVLEVKGPLGRGLNWIQRDPSWWPEGSAWPPAVLAERL
jgi:dihydroorotate dehydrogenase electron transfer subunit